MIDLDLEDIRVEISNELGIPPGRVHIEEVKMDTFMGSWTEWEVRILDSFGYTVGWSRSEDLSEAREEAVSQARRALI